MHILYSVKGYEPRRIDIPTTAQALAVAPWRRNGLERYVATYGNEGIALYCESCFTHSSITLLEIHDGSGCVRKII